MLADNPIGSFFLLAQIGILGAVVFVAGFKLFNYVYDAKERELFGDRKARMRPDDAFPVEPPRCLKD
ncbi:hypothetical protein SPRG_02394 [Saprolegnia parasitica CBS 223.65]|uniref:Uncharacterized protein n=1 Tax=Saprolegnia parasitica (strain CBS 223.65) TaxID=695850 RepID=A0A067CPV4_SAPPC|nr:hypothetical protein SPRG_02394 [Saprolegnia parasitica CBS 223.65]KDO32694.1 hypothetical protein SPRG_02394 [Saprolegnia parasitica CBS 223.65]|eukprot:XP_012196360.1 hypothetical protein SPRG_02394 [Saprolegnia parasitica CBS 223.65]